MTDPSTAATPPVLRLRRTRLAQRQAVPLDGQQQAAVSHRGSPVRILGAPGTGKTSTLVEAVAVRVLDDGLDAGRVLVLAPTRQAAARLRELVTARLQRTVREPLARTPQSFAFGVLRLAAARAGLPTPRLITGPEQDLILRELLTGHLTGAGRPPSWPAELLPALGTRAFRGQLRDLLMRAVERGLGPDDLAALGLEHAHPEWVAAADVLAEYVEVTALSTPGGFDPATIAGAALSALAEDADLLTEVRGQVQLVAMDDAHEATPVVAELLRVLVGPRDGLLLTGDPDAVTQAFRGADPGFLLGAGPGPAAGGEVIVLGTSWRQAPALRTVTERVAARIGAVGGARQRRPQPAPDGPADAATSPVPPAQVQVLRTTAHEVAVVAEHLRRRHLADGVPWQQMAVVVRGRARSATLRRGLALAGVPVDVPLTDLPVRDQPAVVPLLDAYESALDWAAGRPDPLDEQRAEALLLSALGGADALRLRRLRQALRVADPESSASTGALVVQALLDPARLAVLEQHVAEPARRVAEVLAAGRAAAGGPSTDDPDAPTAESVLWALWSASRLSPRWRRAALSGGPQGARADADLDAVVALFDAAERFVDRLPQAGPRAFVEYLRGQDVPGDTLAERGTADGVALLTPASAAGRQWHTVVVAGVQDGVWPDLRVRGSLLGSQDLVDLLAGRQVAARAAVAAVREDETRLFHVAVSRATRSLLVTAVRDDEQQPSPFLDLVDPPPAHRPAPGWDEDGGREVSLPPVPMSLSGVVSRLRQVLTDPLSDPSRRVTAAGHLARLAVAEVPGAHPGDWYGLAPLSDPRPLASGHPVRVSPSRVEEFDRCALRWLLQQAGGRPPSSSSQNLGNLVHELAAELPDADHQRLLAELHRRWGVLDLRPGWVGDVQRRRAEQVVGKLADYLRGDARRRALVGTELAVDVTVELPSGPARLTGRVDRLEQDPADGLVVVDLKTGKSQPKVAELEALPQLGVYQVAAQQGAFERWVPGRSAAGAALVQLGTTAKKPAVQEQPALPPDGGWARDLLDQVADGMSQATFSATLNDMCERCPVRTSCPARGEGRQVTS